MTPSKGARFEVSHKSRPSTLHRSRAEVPKQLKFLAGSPKLRYAAPQRQRRHPDSLSNKSIWSGEGFLSVAGQRLAHSVTAFLHQAPRYRDAVVEQFQAASAHPAPWQ